MVAIVRLFLSLIVHIPLLKVMEYPALSRQLIEIRVKAISGACIAFLKTVFVFFDPFGSSTCISPIPIAFMVLPSAVVMLQSIGL